MARIKIYNTSGMDFVLYRILPGLLTIILITSPFWTTLLGIYDLLLVYLAFLTVYIFYQSTAAAIGEVISYRRMLRDERRNWADELTALDFDKLPSRDQLPEKLSDIYPLFFIPCYKEPYEELTPILDSLVEQDYPYLKNVIIVFGMEERGGPERRDVAEKIVKNYKQYFKDIWISYHPEGIPGEIIGDACANLRCAGINASKWLQKEGIPSKNVIFSKSDADARYYYKYLSAMVYKYLTDTDRMHKFFSPAIIIYSNNFWRVPAISRVFWGAMTIGVAAEWVYDKRKKQSFSCYSANYALLEKIDYWDATVGAEDTYFYWNALLHSNGNFSGEEIYMPLRMECIEGKNVKSTMTALYKQQLRWGWGAIIMSLALQGMSWNKQIKFQKKLEKTWVLIRAYNFLSTVSIVLAIAMPVITLLNRNLEYSAATYLLPRTISIVMTVSLLFQIPHKYFVWRYYGSPPKEKSLLFKIWWWGFEHFLFVINIWTYYLVPRLHAQYEMTVGKERKKFFIGHEARID